MKPILCLLIVCFFTSCVSYYEMPLEDSYSEIISNETCYDFIQGKWKMYKKSSSLNVSAEKAENSIFQFSENDLQIEERKGKYYFEDDCKKLVISFEEKNISFHFYMKPQDTIRMVNRVLPHESLVIGLKRVKCE